MLSTLFSLSAQPFPADSGDWQWVPIEGSKCIDGAETGVYVRYGKEKNASKLGVYLAGGGACFNVATCATCSKTAHPGKPGNGGIFSTSDSRNPFKDYTWISVPYCSGDVHLGDIEKRVGVEKHTFHGRTNLGLILDRAKATFKSPSDIVLTGESAGGFGAFANFPFFRDYWPDSRAVMVDDSGPIIDDSDLASCLQKEWRSDWDVDNALPAGCPCVGQDGNMSSGWAWFKQKYPKDSIGLISSVQDSVISLFFSYGNDGCSKSLPGVYTKIYDGLKKLAAQGIPVYMIPGGEHTHTGGKSSFFTQKSDNKLLYEWVTQLVDASQPDPPSVDPKAEIAIEDQPSATRALGMWAEYAQKIAHRVGLA
jgi:hypothetical protein